MSSGKTYQFCLSFKKISTVCLSLRVSDKIKAYTGDIAFLIFCIVPHISSIFRNLTGFCDFFRSAWCSIEIKRNSVLTIKLQFPSTGFCGFLFSCDIFGVSRPPFLVRFSENTSNGSRKAATSLLG